MYIYVVVVALFVVGAAVVSGVRNGWLMGLN